MAYSFTASSTQYLSVADTAALDITGAITLAAWIKSTGTYGTVGKGIVAKYETGTNQRSYAMQLDSSGRVNAAFGSNGTPSGVRNIRGQTASGTNWRHVAATFVPSTTTNAIYLDGVSESVTVNSAGTVSSIFSGSANLWLGLVSTTSTASVDTYFDGLIAEVGIWNVALTAEEVASLADGMTCDKVRPQSLVFYAPLVRDLVDVKGGLTITNNNTATVANHPRVYA
jgi:hypothetical protein